MSIWGIHRRTQADLTPFRRCPSCGTGSRTDVYCCDTCRTLFCEKCAKGWVNTYCPDCGAACDKQRDHYGYV